MKKMIKRIIILALFIFTIWTGTAYAKEPMPCPECAELDKHIDRELQEYIWRLCTERYPDGKELELYYSAMIGLADGESEFDSTALNKKSIDRGLYQVNKCWVDDFQKMKWITCAEDLYDPYISAKCGEYIWWWCWNIGGGWNESSYMYYLYGRKHSLNDLTKRVWKKQQKWHKTIFYDKENNRL